MTSALARRGRRRAYMQSRLPTMLELREHVEEVAAGRRGDRVDRAVFAAADGSASGTKRTWPVCGSMSAFGGKADINRRRANVR
jgi:hypothetical protein